MEALRPLLLATVLAGFVPSPLRAADKPRPDAAAADTRAAKAKPYPLDFRLVSDEKFEASGMTPFEMVQDGETIKFCCKNGVKDFKKEPKRFLTKLADEVKKQEAAKAKK